MLDQVHVKSDYLTQCKTLLWILFKDFYELHLSRCIIILFYKFRQKYFMYIDRIFILSVLSYLSSWSYDFKKNVFHHFLIKEFIFVFALQNLGMVWWKRKMNILFQTRTILCTMSWYIFVYSHASKIIIIIILTDIKLHFS